MNATSGHVASGPWQVEENRVSFWLRVRPRSSPEGLEWTPSGELCLRIGAAPVEGQANEACVRLLAKCLRLPQNAVTIAAGLKSRRKLIRIDGPSAEETIERLRAVTGAKARPSGGR
jgi:uncharacterized protein